ncbi:hypothetical protein [Kordia sp.]|uniref:hypothetical protein n=1 Tax=Kordia sp. TaxID=1965332 RepID=UPI003B5A4939
MKKYIAYLFMAFILFNCSEDEASLQELAEVQITNVNDVTVDAAQVTSEVITNGGTTITSRGICWSTTQNPTTNDDTTSNGTGTGVYTSNITNLVPNSTYYIRAYAINATGTAYSEQEELSTNLPEVNAAAITNITGTSAESGGEVTNEGGASVTAKGICWSTSPNPITTDNVTNDGDGIGTFTSTLTGLTENETYYVRAYATNNIGTAYSDEVEFSTNLPSVTTNTITYLSVDSSEAEVEVEAEVTDEGTTEVTERGITWSTSPNPTIDGDYLISGQGAGTFNTTIDNLEIDQTYYIRAYAINSIGIMYGNEIEFLPSSCGLANETEGTVTLSTQDDVDNFNYSSVGSLIIENSSSITNISLPCLTKIDYILEIKNNPNLTSINLEGLTSLASRANELDDGELNHYPTTLDIDNNPALTNINMPNLSGFIGIVDVKNCANLTTLELPLVEQAYILSIKNMPSLNTLNVDSLSLVGSIQVFGFSYGGIRIIGTNLSNVDTFASLQSGVMRYLTLKDNPSLQNLNGFNTSSVAIEFLDISGNPLLTNLDGLASINRYDEVYLKISDNDALVNIDGIANYTSVNVYSVEISDNNSLANLNGLSNIDECLLHGLVVVNNSTLSDLCGLTAHAYDYLQNQSNPYLDPCNLQISGNAYNPSPQDIVDGNCSQ